MDYIELGARHALGEDHRILGIEAIELLGGTVEVNRLGVRLYLGQPLLGHLDVSAMRAMLEILVIGVESLVVLALLGVILGDAEKVGGIGLCGILERQARESLVEVAHALGEGHDDLHRDGVFFSMRGPY